MKSLTCGRCGAQLDFGEKCDCAKSIVKIVDVPPKRTKYAIIDSLADGDWFSNIYSSEAEAISAADTEWSRMSTFDKNRRSEYYVSEVEVDKDDVVISEVRIVKTYKAWR
jgi:hypothetical protein